MSSPLERAVSALPLPPGWRIRVQIRPRRRTLGIEVASDGSVLLAVPVDADVEEVTETLLSNVDRVARAVRRRVAEGAEQPVKELVDGEHFSYLGRSYRLRLREEPKARVRLVGGWLELPVNEGVPVGKQAIIDWYTTRCLRWCKEHVSALASRAGVPVPAVKVLDLGNRWGERRADGSINLHWAVMQMSSPLIELVLAHELTHLRTARHSVAFKEQLTMLVPGLESLERQLAAEEKAAWRGHVRVTARPLIRSRCST
ncbi:M48 family metallopeptidase [Streptosporangium sandarakinum]|uniref:M48 family metallopeptidase n=1 Tax=Streptosporangium sandarakinum TaxID=1260955 RepID=UPI00368D296F